MLIRAIIKAFIKNHRDTADASVREAYGVLSGVLGILCNLVLFITKLAVGLFIDSIAVVSDAFNNLSDLGSSLVTVFGAKLSSRPPDKEHPHGHGRFEYVASLAVAFIIFGVGLQILRSSVEKIIAPKAVLFNPLSLGLLVGSILIKVWMYSYNKYIGRVINSGVNRAVARDSLNDALATGAVIAGTVLGRYVDFPVDGLLGLVISLLIMYSGFSIAKDSVNLLLGAPPDPQLVDNICSMVLKGKNVKGVHDLIVHDYGPGRVTASIHAEVSHTLDIIDIHSEIDEIEQRIEDQLGINIVIHMDPVREKPQKAPGERSGTLKGAGIQPGDIDKAK
ncbi:MAG TPA: cation diffusion facilitator family transporter [Bacillota bacterium]|nr:cation diffusion facilitator family transporter [Bacillota bacterium]HQA47929.1 cation diffusion facilitator family transporter [Bacillota bacterium]HQD41327.1 cation diffusion facilitator family transporter [Bacillota bacterium]